MSAIQNNVGPAAEGKVQIPSITKPPSRSVLAPFPGFTPASAEAARKVVDDNHKRFHIFFNKQGFHNHFSHHVLASLALGLPESGFEKIYEKEKKDMLHESFEYNHKPILVDPRRLSDDKTPEGYGKHGGVVDRIDESNWTKHLGDHAYYWSYLVFFEDYVQKHGVSAALDKFVFGEEANAKGVDSLARFIGGILHPLIHVGYGLEFNMPAIVAEGLAMNMLTENNWHSVFPTDMKDLASITSASGLVASARSAAAQAVSQISQALPSTVVEQASQRLGGLHLVHAEHSGASASKPHAGFSLLSILDLIGQDSELAPNAAVKASDKVKTRSALQNAAPILLKKGYFDLWKLTEEDVKDPNEATQEGGWIDKWEELVWLSVLSLGATSQPNHKPKHDFFLMHVNNSVLFLPAILPHLKSADRAKLLQAEMRVAVLLWIARGRPSFYIKSTLGASTEYPYNPNAKVDFGEMAVIDRNKITSASGGDSPWFDLVGAASVHSDEHQTKAVRSLAYFSQHFGQRVKGSISLQTEEIKKEMLRLQLRRDAGEYKSIFEGIDELDGTAFVRTAGQLFETQGWTRSDTDNLWDYDGPGYPETWQ